MGRLHLPPSGGRGEMVFLEDVQSVVLIGANGSGKTRLGYWIEESAPIPMEVHRVAAQRALTFAEHVQPLALEPAINRLHYGHDRRERSTKAHRRWSNQPLTALLSDFDHVLTALWAHERERDRRYTRNAAATHQYTAVPESNLEKVRRIWAKVLPHRELVLGEEKLEARIQGGGTYAANKMSDGERVVLYLLGQCLCAPTNAIIVIDEPEVHLHRSIQSPLWDEIERERSDCVFVYLTHDLDFAASRATAKKLWIKSWTTHWDWEEVPNTDTLPEPLLLEVLGSRKPILFVEGERGSLDEVLYRFVYPDHLILPRGSCQKVIEATRGLRNNPALHHLSIYGIIDRDHRTDEELKALAEQGILAASVAEIENLLCVPEIVREIANLLKLDADAVIKKVKSFVLKSLADELPNQITARAVNETRFRLNTFSGPAATESELRQAAQSHLDNLNFTTIFKSAAEPLQRAIATNDYLLALRHYNRKSLPARIAPYFGFNGTAYPDFLLRQLKSSEAGPLTAALRAYLPAIP